jgi:hypothetical protein
VARQAERGCSSGRESEEEKRQSPERIATDAGAPGLRTASTIARVEKKYLDTSREIRRMPSALKPF